MKKIVSLLLIIGLFGCSSNAQKYPILQTESNVDLEKYSGDWYEIARIDHWFQKGCTKSTARYEIRNDGEVDVINQCTKDNEFDEARGRAWVTDKDTNAKLKVQFPLKGIKLPFLAGDYWIIELDDDYQHVMVGENKREYLWILNREQKMDPDTLNILVKRAEKLGFPVDQLIYEP